MARLRDPNRNKAFEIYQKNKGRIDLVEIARQLNVSAGSVRGWKSKDKWEQKLNGTFPKNMERSQRKKGGQPNNRNATGPPGNKHAVKSGLFERFLPAETLDIVDQIKNKSPLDLLWDQILLAYAAILRAQKVMFVKHSEDHDVINSGYSRGKVSGETYAVTSANDKQGAFLSSLSRVQSQLNNMIKQYDKMIREDPLATEEQKARIENIRARTEVLQGDNLEIEDTEDIDGEIFGKEKDTSV